MPEIDFFWTVVISLIVGISANLLTPRITSITSKLFSSFRKLKENNQRVFDNSVQHLVDNPTDEVNLRVEKNGRWIRSWVLIVGALVIAGTGSSVFHKIPSLFLVFVSLVFAKQATKYQRLVSAAWDKRKEQYGDIDLR